MPTIRYICVLLIWGALTSSAFAERVGWDNFWERQQGQPVEVDAKKLEIDKDGSSFTATGDVRLKQGEIQLHADQVQWDQDEMKALAKGGVRLETSYTLMTGEEISIAFADGAGYLRQGKIMLKDRPFVLSGDLIERLDSTHYRFQRGEFTTCQGDSPAWHVSAEEVNAYPDSGYATGKHAVFYLADIPVLYTPYFIVPIGEKRQTGFLLPKFGYSERRGQIAEIPFFWAIARNQDATFYLDYLSDLGVGKGVDYRYVFGRDSRGQLRYYHINGLKDASDRYAIAWEHLSVMSRKWRMTADVEYVSKKDYFEDFGEAADEYTKDESRSEMVLSRAWDRHVVTGRVKYLRSLIADNDATLQRFPELRYDLLPQRLFDVPVYMEWEHSLTHFWRRDGETGGRLVLYPKVWGEFEPVPGISLMPELAAIGRFYRVTDSESSRSEDLLPEFRVQARAQFARHFPIERSSWLGFRHQFKPVIHYRYLPKHGQNGLPLFDQFDRLAPSSRIGYSLGNRIIGKYQNAAGNTSYREILYLELSQYHEMADLTEEERIREGLEGDWSPLRLQFELRPTPHWLFEGDLSYQASDDRHDWTDVHIFSSLGDQKANSYQVGWSYRRDEFSYLAGSFDTSLLAPVYIHAEERFDLDKGGSFEEVVEAEYRGACWSVKLSFRNRDDDRQYIVSFNLTGLGSSVRFGGELEGSGSLFE
ncbi:MAG: hypothetical protein C0616_10000 [Desulfuromonas sp.]|nr:MAG: hypothetical protein C0616_10000 [Desulfuromonas sp.]